MSSACPCKGGPAGGVRRVVPEVPRPSSAILSHVPPAQRALLERLLTEPLEYVDHPRFRDGRFAARLFCSRARRSAKRAGRAEKRPARRKTTGILTLSPELEKRLFLQFNYARYRLARLLERYRGRQPGLPAVRAMLLWARRALAAREAIVRANLPLVLAMAKRSRLAGVDYAELISEGNMALLRSVDKFDCSRGYKFSTYACRAILKSFSRVAMRTSRYRGRFPAEFDPSLERSDFLERKRERVESDCLEAIRNIMAENLAQLSEVEQTVIRERFALHPVNRSAMPKTLEQVGLMVGVTKERVRQIQNKALRKLRAALEANVLSV